MQYAVANITLHVYHHTEVLTDPKYLRFVIP